MPLPARRLLSTIAHLRPVQVVGRAHRPWRVWRGARVDHDGSVRARDGEAVPPLPLPGESVSDGMASLAGRDLRIDGAAPWNPVGATRLQAYRLHAFRWVHALPPREADARLRDWVRTQSPGSGPGWEPYCLSLRIREWLEWVLAHPEAPSRRTILESVARQSESLLQQVEHHLLGNHVLENAITLCWAGLRLRGRRTSAWLRRGLALLRTSLAEQILRDGGHAERTPTYHALLAEALLRLAEVARQCEAPGAGSVEMLSRAAGGALLDSLAVFVHPDGEYALVNDTAHGMAPTWDAIAVRHAPEGAGAPRPGLTALAHAGFLGWRCGAEHLLFDVGPIGPRHQPGHGHAGALGFEWSLAGERLVTDTGAFSYERGESRAYDRSTAAHSTVEVDGRDQSEVWSAFRCGRRIRAGRPRWRLHEDGATLEGTYSIPWIAGRVLRHSRRIRARGRFVHVVDLVRCRGEHTATTRIHLAPGVMAERTSCGASLCREGRVVAEVVGGGDWRIEASPYHPTFGREIERVSLVSKSRFRARHTDAWSVRARED